jgi:hypothetical protein
MKMPPAIIRIGLQRGVWRVTLDEKFYGDYRSKMHAAESADSAARALRERGRIVHVLGVGGV